MAWPVCPQKNAIRQETNLFDREFPVDPGHHDAAIFGIGNLIDHQQIPIVDAETGHGIARDAHDERCRAPVLAREKRVQAKASLKAL